MAEYWTDGPHAHEINQAMSAAREAFDYAYCQSPSSADLAANATRTIEALAAAVRMALAQARLAEGAAS